MDHDCDQSDWGNIQDYWVTLQFLCEKEPPPPISLGNIQVTWQSVSTRVKCVVKEHEHDESLWKDAEQSEARKKIGVHQLMKGQFTVKYLIFREIPCVVQIFPVLFLNSLYFPCLEKLMTEFPVSLSGKIDDRIPCFPVWKNWWPNSLFSLCRGMSAT